MITSVRHAKLSDVANIWRMAKGSGTAAHWREEDYTKAIEGSSPARVVLIADENDVIAGFLVGLNIGSEWEIENVVVDPEKRRCGLGNALVQVLLERAEGEGAEAVFLEVRESNRAARRLYEKCGFVEVGRRKGYYSGPVEEAVVYRKTGFLTNTRQVK